MMAVSFQVILERVFKLYKGYIETVVIIDNMNINGNPEGGSSPLNA